MRPGQKLPKAVAPKPLAGNRAHRKERYLCEYVPPRGGFDPDCTFCMVQFELYGPHCIMPSHTPSKNCESGKQPHCTCDVCF